MDIVSTIINKLDKIDDILAGYEDWMHGSDSESCTKARKLLNEVITELKNTNKAKLCKK